MDNKLSITRGDTMFVRITPVGYVPKEGDTIKLQVRDDVDRGNLVIDGDVCKAGDDIVWYIHPEDTKDLETGTYYWDAEIDTAEGDVFTYLKEMKLIVRPARTEA